jgi:hypothetical protein
LNQWAKQIIVASESSKLKNKKSDIKIGIF